MSGSRNDPHINACVKQADISQAAEQTATGAEASRRSDLTPLHGCSSAAFKHTHSPGSSSLPSARIVGWPAARFTNTCFFCFFSASIQSVEKNVDLALERLFLEVDTKQTSAAGLRPAETASVFHLKVTSAPAGVKSRGLLMGRRPLWRTLAANV